ncbi:MAG: PqqD family protein [Thermoanaerobaculia bacterium]
MTSIQLSSRYGVRPGVMIRELDGEAILLDVASSHYFRLNDSGRQILDLVDGERELEAILETLTGRYDSPRDELASDLVGLVAELEREGLLVRLE